MLYSENMDLISKGVSLYSKANTRAVGSRFIKIDSHPLFPSSAPYVAPKDQ